MGLAGGTTLSLLPDSHMRLPVQMLSSLRRCSNLIVAALLASTSRRLPAQTHSVDAGSLRLRYMRVQVDATDSCQVFVHTSGSMGIEASVTATDARLWIDSATAMAKTSPARAKGARAEYRFLTPAIGIKRVVTDRFDAFSFIIWGHEIPMMRPEIPRLARLLDSALTRTRELSHDPHGATSVCDQPTR